MDTPNTNGLPGAQPAAAQVTAVIQESAQPLDNSIAHAIEMMDQESLMALLDGNPLPESIASVDTTQAPADPTPQLEPAGELPAGAEPAEAIPAEPNQDDGTPRTLNRISVRGLPAEQAEQMAAAAKAVKAGLVPDIATYFRQITRETAAATEQAQTQPQAETPPAPEPAPRVTELQAQLATLREQRKQANLDYLTETADALTNQIEDTLMEIQVARIAEANQAAQVATYQQTHETAVDAVEAKYGALLDDTNSPFGEFLNNAVLAAQATNDPALQDPRFIIGMADKIAAQLGINGTSAAPARTASAPQPPTGPPARASRPVGSTMAAGHTQAPRYTPDQIRQLIDSAPIEALQAAVFTQ